MKKHLGIVVRKENKILMVKHIAMEWKNKWFFPGFISRETDDALSISDAIKKLCYRQTGFVVTTEKVLFSEYINNKNRDSRALYILLSAFITGGAIKTYKTDYSYEAAWLTLDEIKLLDSVIDIPTALLSYNIIFKWLDSYSRPIPQQL
jgi:ADP-ribose pyrophosphatase YjhB (NUDIX family)